MRDNAVHTSTRPPEVSTSDPSDDDEDEDEDEEGGNGGDECSEEDQENDEVEAMEVEAPLCHTTTRGLRRGEMQVCGKAMILHELGAVCDACSYVAGVGEDMWGCGVCAEGRDICIDCACRRGCGKCD